MMSKSKMEKNIMLYKWFIVFIEPLFWGPTIIYYLQNAAKMSINQILTMEAVIMISAGLLEIPSGALADIIGRKKTMFIGSISMLASVTVLAFVNSPFEVWIGNTLWMIAYCMKSGADSAFLYDSLKKLNREKDYKKIEGIAQSNKYLALGFCALSIGFLSKINLRIPFFLAIPGVSFSCIIALLFKEPIQEEKYKIRKQFKIMKESLIYVYKQKALMWTIGFAALILISSKMWFFTFNPYFELVKLDIFYWGIIFFFLNIVSWFFSRNAHAVGSKINKQTCVILMPLLIGIPMLLMSFFVSQTMISVIPLQAAVRGFTTPFIGELLNRYSDTRKRATIISIKSTIIGFVSFFSLRKFGSSIENNQVIFSLQVLGIIVLIIGFLLIIQYRKIFLKTKSPC
jgi:MFS family permease